MLKLFLSSLAWIVTMGSGIAFAMPTTPFFATAEMVATVRSASVSGALLDTNGNYVRDLTLADTPFLPWNVGDRLTVRWEQHSKDLVDCTPGNTGFWFGGITAPTSGSYVGPCYSSDAASFVRLDRARGGTSPVWDGWETMASVGPFFDLKAGEVVPYFEPIDGLVTDCCVYLYDSMADKIITLESNGAENPAFPSWPVQFLWVTIFDGANGGGGMNLYSSEMFGIFEWENPETGEIISLGSIADGYFSVDFDVQWRSSLQSIAQVPEPGALAMIGAGLLAAAGLARRRHSRP